MFCGMYYYDQSGIMIYVFDVFMMRVPKTFGSFTAIYNLYILFYRYYVSKHIGFGEHVGF